MLIGKLQIKASRLPVIAQQGIELRMLIRRDFTVELGMNQGFKIHESPSD